jgi:ribosomal protein L37E
MGVRDVLPVLTDGGTDSVTTHVECRECGENLTADVEQCPECGGGVAVYDFS